ncbi:hypothetical protein MXM41_09570 [Leclercia adecarboxylata]|uniref:hypothetical protein n=1 Tax=Leclercia adecarboxylata TaxID=83655 RepID=UPI002DBE1B50|nr:hypothetical protein [Leclercia adecarboxylata]MEB6379179.1 hypothetical protein [Leclercia adecarboxylata]
MSISRHNLTLRSLLVLTVIIGLSGCSVRYDKNGKILFNPDFASVLGNEVGQFTLADGSTGALRELNGRYSLKWSNLMIERPLEGVSWARIISQYHIEGHTLLLMKVATPSCPAQYRLVDLQNTRSQEWAFTGVCDTGPEITPSADKLQLNFTTDSRVEQFNWQHGEVYHRRLPVQKEKTVQSATREKTQTSPKAKTQPVAKPVKRSPSTPAEPLPPKVAQPTLDNSLPTEIYAPTKTRQTSLDLKS